MARLAISGEDMKIISSRTKTRENFWKSIDIGSVEISGYFLNDTISDKKSEENQN